jgi:hypothetical protein
MKPLALPISLTPTALSKYRQSEEIFPPSFVLALLFPRVLRALFIHVHVYFY